MTKPHDCPFSAGELLALGAIAETVSHQTNPPAGAARLAQTCYQHARTMHPTITAEGDTDHE